MILLKKKERIKTIDVELDNWNNLISNSSKMENDLIERRNKILKEIEDNNKDPEKLATTKGQNLQNLENTKKRNEELNLELEQSEDRYNSINKNVKEIQEKLATLREGKARNEATLEGIEARRKRFILFNQQ